MDAATKYGLILLVSLILVTFAATMYGLKVAWTTQELTRGTLRGVRRLRRGQKKQDADAARGRAKVTRMRATLGFLHLSLERFLARGQAAPGSGPKQ